MMKFSSKSWGTTTLKTSIKQPYVNLCICDPSNMAVQQISRLLLNKELFLIIAIRFSLIGDKNATVITEKNMITKKELLCFGPFSE